MTKTTIKALVGGGGLIATTWFAVTPGQNAPVAPVAVTPSAGVVSQAAAHDQLPAQTEQLRRRETAPDLKPATRNPFRFGAPIPDASTPASTKEGARVESFLPPPPPAPTLTLSGIAEKRGPTGNRRLAVISSDTRLYVATEGDVVEGRYTIVAIDTEAVLLRDFAGAELRLILRP